MTAPWAATCSGPLACPALAYAAAAAAAYLLAATPASAVPLPRPEQVAQCSLQDLNQAAHSDSEQSQLRRHTGGPVTELAGFLGFGDSEDGDEPVDPFTLYGTLLNPPL